jgi:hypothetical protein
VTVEDAREMVEAGGKQDRRVPWSLVVGAALILVCEALLVCDIWLREGVIAGHGDPLPKPEGVLGLIARQGAVNMTPLCWVGYLLLMDGLLMVVGSDRDGGGSPVRRRPRRFVWCFLTSVPMWLLFDWINFRFIHAWDYHNLPPNLVHRYIGYFVAFGAINPGMFLSAELISRLWMRGMRGPRWAVGRTGQGVLVALGAIAVAVAFIVRAPVASVPLWLAMPFICDALNAMLGAPSILGDLRTGRWGRLVALLAGGLWCGFLWEFWNYWAAAKWTYDLAFLGPLERVRYFEMPLPGLLGFLPFAVGCWAAYGTIAWLLGHLFRDGGRLRPEPLPNGSTIL